MFLVFFLLTLASLWEDILFWFYSPILSCKISLLFVKRIREKDTEGTGWDLLFIPYNLLCIQRVASLNFFILCGVMLNQDENE
jgi:hypothetical protein